MSQTAYSDNPGIAIAGLIDSIGQRVIETAVNKSAGAMPFGIAVKENAERSAILLAAAGDKILGIVAHEHLEATSGTGSDGLPVSKPGSILRKGRVYVVTETAMALGADVFVRHTANGAGKLQLGAFRNDSDSGNARQVYGARVVEPLTDAGGIALIEFDFLTDAACLESLAAANVAEVARESMGYIAAVAGAKAGNDREVACTLKDGNGTAITDQRPVMIRSLAVTDHKGDLAAAAAPVGTILKTNNPATGENTQAMVPTNAGLFSFKVTDDVAEAVVVTITAEGCKPKVLNLSFA